MEEFKAKIRQMELVVPPFLLPVAELEQFNALPQATKDALNIHMRTHVAAATMNLVSNLLITAGLKPSLRMEILKRENLTLPQIKDLALKYENLQNEKPVKNGNTSTINATDYANEEKGVRELKRSIEQITQKINMLRMYNSPDLPFYIKDFSLPFIVKKEHMALFLKKKESSDAPPPHMYM